MRIDPRRYAKVAGNLRKGRKAAVVFDGQYYYAQNKKTLLKYEANTDQFEELLMGIVKLTVRDYQRKLMDELKEKKPKTKARMNEVIQRFRKKAMVTDGLEFLKGTCLGEYLIQSTEDQVVVRYTHPDLAKLPYEKRYDSMLEKRKELQRERLKQKEKSMYATIKGRSVKHDLG
jgi:hypothetical protein